MIILDDEQGSDMWLDSRLGLPTASQFSNIVTIKGERSKSRDKYLYKLSAEKMTGTREETYSNSAMLRGTELEAEARTLFTMLTDINVTQVGLCMEDNRRWGFSPDGLIGDDGGVEIKCPSAAVHVSYLLGNKLPTDYFQQVHGSLAVSGRNYWYFVSYYPGLKPFIIKVLPDQTFNKMLIDELELFVIDLEFIMDRIK